MINDILGAVSDKTFSFRKRKRERKRELKKNLFVLVLFVFFNNVCCFDKKIIIEIFFSYWWVIF